MTGETLHKTFAADQRRYERKYFPTFFRALRAQIRAFVLSGGDYNAVSTEPIVKAYLKVYRGIAADYTPKVQAEIRREERQKADMPPSDTQKYIVEYLKRFGAKKIVGVTEKTRSWLRLQVERGLADGKSFQEIAKSFIVSPEQQMRALRIARTESVAAMNFARLKVASDSPFQKEKEWISAHDERVRPGAEPGPFDHHQDTIGIRELENSFFVSGEDLMFPGDTSEGASPGNTINCRCTMGIRSVRDANGRLKKKPVNQVPKIFVQLQVERLINDTLQQRVDEIARSIGHVTVIMPKALGSGENIYTTRIDHENGKTFFGPNVRGDSPEDAEKFCNENGFGYCEIDGELIAEIDEETGEITNYKALKFAR